MRYTYAISGLRRKRATLAGEIEAAERAIAKQREALVALDATLRLFHPDADPAHIASIRPQVRNVWFRHGERRRFAMEALRDAGAPLPTRLVAEYVMRAKGMDLEDRPLRAAVRKQVHLALLRLAARGTVRKLMSEPEAWWELAE